MSAFLTLSAMTSALLMLMAALMDRRAVQAGRLGQVTVLRGATVLSALFTLPVAWVVWQAAGAMQAVLLLVVSALWHAAIYFLFAFWIKSLSRRVARGQPKA